ncbi:Bbp16 family capsid cement protein [Herminiimonas contaminans]|uniref:Uncharacterized protein n=1 Tax=Herminiimonas contaminans TaxID=1111140 RepID=A0ABS0ESI9_9BURK|nr:hypothetical protein [Herminiimonas contaminans]MBF8177811.1 hypothetical protein [Herminiimonas contaminans]
MYIDKHLQLSAKQAVTADVISANVIDLGVPGRNLGAIGNLMIALSVDVAADATTGDETYTFTARTSAAAAMTSPSDVGSITIPAASLKAGSLHFLPIAKTDLRYLGLFFDVGGTTPSVTVTAWLTTADHVADTKAYPDAL